MNPLDLPLQSLPRAFANEPSPPFKEFLRSGLGGTGAEPDLRRFGTGGSTALYDRLPAGPTAFVARSAGALACADRLVAERYAWRGYCTPPIEPLRRDLSGLTGPYVSLLCRISDCIAGTITLGLDSAEGLFADQVYGEQVDALRRQGRSVCELVRFAVSRGVDYKAVLDALFNLSYQLGRVLHGVTDLVIEVNPRHVMFYRRLLGFSVLGEEKYCLRVGAPSVLLLLSVDRLFCVGTGAA